MPKYLIEVPHAPDVSSCYQTIHIFLTTGSHFLTHCDWGCKDGVHKAWFTIDADSKDDALRVLPPAFRPDATIVELGKFTIEEVETALAQHSSC